MLTISLVTANPISVLGNRLTLASPSFTIERSALLSVMYTNGQPTEAYSELYSLLNNSLITIVGDGLTISNVAGLQVLTSFSIGIYNLIFRPGSVSQGNIFTSATEIADVLASVNGAVSVYIDDSIAPCIMPSGVIWDFQGYGSIIANSETFPTLLIEDGAQVRNLGIISGGVLLQCNSKTLPSIDFTDWSGGPTLLLNYSEIVLMTGTTISPISVPANATFNFIAEQSTEFSSTDAPTISFITLGANAFLITYYSLFTSTPAELFPLNFVGGESSATWIYNADASGFPLLAYTFTGTIYSTYIDNAIGVLYGDGTTTVAAALDALQPKSGNTAARPVGAAVGQNYFDTSLGTNGGLLITWTGVHWINGAGAIV
jgi:hypothetical protein